MSAHREAANSSTMRKRANQSGVASDTDPEKVQLKVGYPPYSATVEIDIMKSRMGLATESHFTNLNTKIIERKQDCKQFDPAKILNPALRATIKQEDDSKKDDFIKIKALFMGEEAKKRLDFQNQRLVIDNNKKPGQRQSVTSLNRQSTDVRKSDDKMMMT